MATTVWKGHLTFGLVSIPVRLFKAARAEKVTLHKLHRPSREQHRPIESAPPAPPPTPRLQPQSQPQPQPEPAPVTRIHQSAFVTGDNTPIPRNELIRGYEYEKGQYAVVEDEDLRSITPRTGTEMQIVEFVRFSEIDPIYLETSYYMAPDEAGEKAYALLFEGMRESGYVALANVAMQRREHVMILRPGKKGIITHTMFYADEVRSIQEFRTDVSLVTPKEMNLAKMLIETLAEPFDPAKFKDTYRERLRELIESKFVARSVAPEETRSSTKVVDIMEALEKSLAAAGVAPRKAATSEGPQKKNSRAK